ncbi:S-adenosyl-L-methionine-dependent methyltransferase [Lojkania enalia]|uniref:S-adenosyl-L-methionine-dependent methyltransferase n=1 Tax=Lojkania enalia TaxID=147567 RepID=A0A9P4NAP2_9PLEO|nr:S-adenosyl-L-methionine-dependent methyltransferase [Didymosphaeria enalia]
MDKEALQTSLQKGRIEQALRQVTIEGSGFLNGDLDARERLIAGARQLVAVAETPVETLLWNIWVLPLRTVAARIAVDLKIFETAVQDNGRSKSNSELAAPTTILARPEYSAGIIFCWDCAQLSFAHMPAYLKSIKFQNPESPIDGPSTFHQYAYILRKHRPSWIEMYPVQNRLVEGLKDSDTSALVDIGGGTGQILQDFRSRELPEVIAAAKDTGVGEDLRIELQVHDFFTPQPIKGARAYFMRSVLHDWADEQCRTIIGHLKDAMEPGYSKILINDCVIADEHAAWQHVSLDLFMMALASAQERTELEWWKLIESCGLNITGIYNKGQGNEGLIEVVLE